MTDELRIGITRGSNPSKLDNYRRWLTSAAIAVSVVDLKASGDPISDVRALDALVLSGGADIEPSSYRMPEAASLCEGVDPERDKLEAEVFVAAEERRLPVLGICRGMQMINVSKGGTLIPHLPARFETGQRHAKNNGIDERHPITVTAGSILYKAAGEIFGEVNSAHHQAVDLIAEGMTASAVSDDGVIEAIEPLDPAGKPYLLAVQWHPERMTDADSPFAMGLLEHFLFEAASRRALKTSW